MEDIKDNKMVVIKDNKMVDMGNKTTNNIKIVITLFNYQLYLNSIFLLYNNIHDQSMLKMKETKKPKKFFL